ncbi:MAG: ribonuclease J [Acidobacteria bacterium 13_1_40CM_65_14]|nr:MAG: ribonuclease J [Acidobacteria bacterium 13_1_40CM_65_14]OLC74030.1 MAG: ribonuclease J [Acidobacteria bacterium 13_1_40CM_4_65_8]OLE82250.1 MAG: ribonuclease J [Acidobacteria bacterium 13_1_20CM_2_65_9]
MLEVVPLGGLGEFGMNMLALSWGETTILVDAGVMFPDPELLGVDRIIPDLTYLQQKGRAAALVLTHGHEDHIGAVPHVSPLVDGPIYGTPLTLALVEPKLAEHDLAGANPLVPVRPRERVTIGPFSVEFIRVTHSMPDCVALAIHTPVGVIVHTGDFKIDQTPIDGEHFDVHRFAQLGSEGVLALFADSTNIDRRGFTGSEREVIEAFEEIFTSATGKLIVAAFASSTYRMQILVDLAAQFDRKVAFVGRGMIQNSEVAQRLGYLRIPAGVQIRDSDVASYPAQDVLCLSTGSQGEPMSALSRMAIDDHRFIKVTDDDTVVISARAIPGNEKAIGRVINHLARRGADVIHEGIKHVHVSGHGSEEELKLMLSLVRPRYFIPIHGEYRQLSQHARVAKRVFAGRDPKPEILLAENGDVVVFDEAGARIAGKAPVGRVLIDDTRTGEVGDEVLRDRRHLAEDGLVVPVVAINKQTGALEGVPDIITRGFVMEDSAALLADGARVLSEVIENASVEERTDQGLIKEKLRVELRRFFRKRSGRRPFVLPVIMEI